jgi:hypothetical protein
LATILLLGLLLFNWFGYRLLVTFLQDQTRKALELRLDGNDYDDSQLVSIRIQVNHLSYYNASDQFERVDGSIDIDGVNYKYVKRRLFKDSAELLCLPDHDAMKLRAFNNDFLRFTSGISTPAKRHGASSLPVKMAMAEPYLVDNHSLIHHHVFIQLHNSDHYTFYFPSSLLSTLERPPAVII